MRVLFQAVCRLLTADSPPSADNQSTRFIGGADWYAPYSNLHGKHRVLHLWEFSRSLSDRQNSLSANLLLSDRKEQLCRSTWIHTGTWPT